MYWFDDCDGDGFVFYVPVYAMFLGNFLVGAVIGGAADSGAFKSFYCSCGQND